MWNKIVKMLYLKLLITFTVQMCTAELTLQSYDNEIYMPTYLYPSFKTTKCSVSQINLELFEQLAKKLSEKSHSKVSKSLNLNK